MAIRSEDTTNEQNTVNLEIMQKRNKAKILIDKNICDICNIHDIRDMHDINLENHTPAEEHILIIEVLEELKKILIALDAF